MLNIDGLMTSLAGRRKLFHSEADFQHALAWQIHEAMPESRIRLEVNAFSVRARRRFLDIWMPMEGIAIELKYVTRTLELEEDGELFALRNHSAQDQRRYDFLLDIERLEHMRSSVEICKAGYAVLLTNDAAYWKIPGTRDTVDAAFRIHEGKDISGEMAWGATRRPRNSEGEGICHTTAGFLPASMAGVFDVSWQSIRFVSVSCSPRNWLTGRAVSLTDGAFSTLVDIEFFSLGPRKQLPASTIHFPLHSGGPRTGQHAGTELGDPAPGGSQHQRCSRRDPLRTAEQRRRTRHDRRRRPLPRPRDAPPHGPVP